MRKNNKYNYPKRTVTTLGFLAVVYSVLRIMPRFALTAFVCFCIVIALGNPDALLIKQ